MLAQLLNPRAEDAPLRGKHVFLTQLLYDRHEELNSVYLERFGDYQRLRERSSDILIDESAS
jgi:hypothetical protein